MVLDNIKYITVEEAGKACQTSSGIWYCKELPFKDDVDLDVKIEKINRVLNRYNKKTENKKRG